MQASEEGRKEGRRSRGEREREGEGGEREGGGKGKGGRGRAERAGGREKEKDPGKREEERRLWEREPGWVEKKHYQRRARRGVRELGLVTNVRLLEDIHWLCLGLGDKEIVGAERE